MGILKFRSFLPKGNTKEIREIIGSMGSLSEQDSSIEIETIQDLIDLIYLKVIKDNRILWFRGHSNSSWELKPSIWRQYNKEEERNFSHRFKSRASARNIDLPKYNESGKWLSLMQHYGLPTRLLDWTRSPMIAMYFALEPYIYKNNDVTNDACIWILEPHELNKTENFGDYTPSIESEECLPVINPAFLGNKKETNQVISVMSTEFDQRMFVQQGAFSIHSRTDSLDKQAKSKNYLTKLIIPKINIKRLCIEMDICGFRKGDLFPDLDNLSYELKNRY